MRNLLLCGVCLIVLCVLEEWAVAQNLADFNQSISDSLLSKKKISPGLLKQWRIRFRSELTSFRVLAQKASDPKAQEIQRLAWHLAFAEFILKSPGRAQTEQMLRKYFDLEYRRDNDFEKKFFGDIAKVYSETVGLDFLESLYSLVVDDEIPDGGLHFVGYYCSKLGYMKESKKFEDCRWKQIEWASKRGAGFEYIKRGSILSLLRYYVSPPLQLEKFRDLVSKTLSERDSSDDFKDEVRALAFYGEIGFGGKDRAMIHREKILEKSLDDERKRRVEYFRLFSEAQYEQALRLFEKSLVQLAESPILSKLSDLQFGTQLYFKLGSLEKARQLALELMTAMSDSEALLRISPLMSLLSLNHLAGEPSQNRYHENLVSQIRKDLKTFRVQSALLNSQVKALELLVKDSLSAKDRKKLGALVLEMKGQYPTSSDPLEIIDAFLAEPAGL